MPCLDLLLRQLLLGRDVVDRPELDDLELPHAGGELQMGDLADGLVKERAADRGSHRDVPLLELDGVAEDEMVRLARACTLILDDDARTEADAVRRDLRDVDRRQLAEPLPEMAESRLDELLPLERGLVLAVFTQVA